MEWVFTMGKIGKVSDRFSSLTYQSNHLFLQPKDMKSRIVGANGWFSISLRIGENSQSCWRDDIVFWKKSPRRDC